VIAEVAHQVPSDDRHVVTTAMAAEAGQHHLNAFEPIIRHFVSESTPTCASPACPSPSGASTASPQHERAQAGSTAWSGPSVRSTVSATVRTTSRKPPAAEPGGGGRRRRRGELDVVVVHRQVPPHTCMQVKYAADSSAPVNGDHLLKLSGRGGPCVVEDSGS
jgi:hypothetical protein